MRVILCGDRDWKRRKIIDVIVDGLLNNAEKLEIVEGAAPGADSLAKESCERYLGTDEDLVVMDYPAQWTLYGNAAGPIRNQLMLDQDPDLVIAFHDDIYGKSKGTKNMVDIASKAGVPCFVISFYGGNDGE